MKSDRRRPVAQFRDRRNGKIPAELNHAIERFSDELVTEAKNRIDKALADYAAELTIEIRRLRKENDKLRRGRLKLSSA